MPDYLGGPDVITGVPVTGRWEGAVSARGQGNAPRGRGWSEMLWRWEQRLPDKEHTLLLEAEDNNKNTIFPSDA